MTNILQIAEYFMQNSLYPIVAICNYLISAEFSVRLDILQNILSETSHFNFSATVITVYCASNLGRGPNNNNDW